MEVTVRENEGCFGIEITAESMVEAALLTRMGANATGEIRYFCTNASQEGTFKNSIVFGKDQRGGGDVPRRNRRTRS